MASYHNDIIVKYKKDILDDDDNQLSRELKPTHDDENISQDVDSDKNSIISNEHTLLLPEGGSIQADKEILDQEQKDVERYLDYRHKNRFIILILVIFIPTGVKFFKASQSSFEEYLMNDPQILMSSTTYSLAVSLMTLPAATLLGGAMLDYKAKKREKKTKLKEQRRSGCFQFLKQRQSYLVGTSRIPSYSANLFIIISLLGIIIYGYGLEKLNSIPIGLAGATVFGLGEGSIVVAAHTFLSHAFYGCDGVIAQGVLMAMNNIAMMASKIFIPRLIENEKRRSREYSTTNDIESNNDNNIWIGMVVCCLVQLLSLSAGLMYACWFGLTPLPQQSLQKPQKPDSPSCEKSSTNRNKTSSSKYWMQSFYTTFFEKLPITFWIIAIGHGIFVVVFKIFTRNSNSFLIEKFGMSPIAAGLKSSFHELFALGSPVVGYLAYRSPGGILPVLLFGAALGSVSIATLACLPVNIIRSYIPGGVIMPILGISMAHGIVIPIFMGIIPQTCSPDQTGMAFAIVEVIGSIFNFTNILFGWLKDTTGSYEAPMKMLLLYSLMGLYLLWISRTHIKLKHPNILLH